MLDRVFKMLSQWAIFFKGLALFIMLPSAVARAAGVVDGALIGSRFVAGYIVGLLVVILTMIIVAIGEE